MEGNFRGKMRDKLVRNLTHCFLLLSANLAIYFFLVKKKAAFVCFLLHTAEKKKHVQTDYSGKENKGALRAIVQFKVNNPSFVEYTLLQPAVKQSHASHFSILHMTVPSRASKPPLAAVLRCFLSPPYFTCNLSLNTKDRWILQLPEYDERALSKISTSLFQNIVFFNLVKMFLDPPLDYPLFLHQFIYFSDVRLQLLLVIINNINNNEQELYNIPSPGSTCPGSTKISLTQTPTRARTNCSSITATAVLFSTPVYYIACFEFFFVLVTSFYKERKLN